MGEGEQRGEWRRVVGRMEKGPGAESKLRGKLRPNQLSLFFLRGPSEQQEGGVFSPVRCLEFVSAAPPLSSL